MTCACGQPVLASRARFEVTSRDRLMLQLAKMPRKFHEMVAGAFGGPSLLELTAAQVLLVKRGSAVSQISECGRSAAWSPPCTDALHHDAAM